MKKRKSYFENFPTCSLFAVLEQNYKELLQLEIKKITKPTPLLKERIRQLELVIAVIKNVIIERYLQDNISLTEIAKRLVKEKGIKQDVYKELLTLKIINSEEFISLELLEQAIDKLELNQIMIIVRSKEDTIYGKTAAKCYDEMIFDVDEEVYKEYINKRIMDSKRKGNQTRCL